MTNVTPGNHVIDRQYEMNKLLEYESIMFMVMWFACVIWGVFFSRKYSRTSHRDPQTFMFFSYKQASGRNDDHEWFRMTNAFILCDYKETYVLRKPYGPTKGGLTW